MWRAFPGQLKHEQNHLQPPRRQGTGRAVALQGPSLRRHLRVLASAPDLSASFSPLPCRRFSDKNATHLPQAYPQRFCPAAGRLLAQIAQRALPNIVDHRIGIDAHPLRSVGRGHRQRDRRSINPCRGERPSHPQAPLSRLPFCPRKGPRRAEGCTGPRPAGGSCSIPPDSSTGR